MTQREKNAAIAAQIAEASFTLNDAVARVNDQLSLYHGHAVGGNKIAAAGKRDSVVSELVNLQETVEALLESFAEIGDVAFCDD